MNSDITPVVLDELDKNRFKDSTIKNFKRFLKTNVEVADEAGINIREQPREFIELLESKYTMGSVKTRLIPLLNFFLLKKEHTTDYYKMYQDRVKEVSKQQKEAPKTFTEKQSKVDVTKGIAKFLKFIEENDFDISGEDRAMLILSFFILFGARRLDYVTLHYNTKLKGLDTDKNWIVRTRKYWYFVFNTFKTDNSRGQQKFKIENPVLIEILDNETFVKDAPIYNSSERTFQRRLNEITNRFFGQELGVRDLRPLLATNEVENDEEGLKFIAKLMKSADISAHSLSTRLNTYIKKVLG